MPFLPVTRIAAAALLLAGLGHSTDLSGSYNVEFTVEGTPYRGTAKATPGSAGQFDLAFTFTDPSAITATAKGRAPGDSVMFEGPYEDKGRGCTGTVSARGVVEEKGDKASGNLSINDSCGGPAAGSFRFWR